MFLIDLLYLFELVLYFPVNNVSVMLRYFPRLSQYQAMKIKSVLLKEIWY